MRTDDDLLDDLATAFRDETADLRYAGRVPAPRTRLVPVTPLVAAAAAAAVLTVPRLGGDPQVATPAPDAPGGSASVAPSRGPGTTPAPPRTVTDTIELAGLTISYERRPGDDPAELYVSLGVRPSDGAEALDGLDTPETAWVRRAWVGTDPVSGHAALWIETRDRESDIGRFAMFWSPDLTVDDLAGGLRSGDPVG